MKNLIYDEKSISINDIKTSICIKSIHDEISTSATNIKMSVCKNKYIMK